MSKKYKEEVLELYNQKKKTGLISANLLEATPAKLRDECSIVYLERYTPQDDDILRLFFTSTEKGYSRSIENFKSDKFRQVEKILTWEKPPQSGIKYYDIIAWLIDFKPRPCSLYEHILRQQNGQNLAKKLDEKETLATIPESTEEPQAPGNEALNQEEEPEVKEIEESEETIGRGTQKKDEFSPTEKTPKLRGAIFKEKSAIVAMLTLVIAITSGLSSILFSNKKDTTPFLPFTGKEKYMYWLGDHYQPTNNGYIKGVNVIPFDAKMVSDFKKITDPDTLTTRSIGKVWYVKLNNKLEYYTADGFHPGDSERTLKPLSKYMVDNHIMANKRLLTLLNVICTLCMLVSFFSIFILYKRLKILIPLPTLRKTPNTFRKL
ncbi:MAG: hypothetical protein ACQUHE_12630 [Bacteroidia bacterium]